jgi:hypothetical protein
MRFLAGFGLVLVTIALVQSKPTISQLDDLNAAIASLPSVRINHFHLSIFFFKTDFFV